MKINNTIKKLLLFIIAPLLTITFITACGDDGDGPTPPPVEELNLVELAQSDEDFSTLVSVIEDLGLEGTLTSGDFTVFAPTNAAFNALPDGVLESLTDEQLLDIIQFHVTEGSVPSSALGAQQDVPMLNEENTLVQSSAAGVVVNGSSNVVKADLEATNGFIHGIDEVLLPSAIRIALGQPNLVDVAQEDGRFETLIGLVEDTGLTTTLQYLGPYTAFAPTDDAFAGLPVDAGTLTTEQLQLILTYHVISGEGIASGDLAPEQAVPSATEELLYITSNEEDGVTVNGNSSVIDADVEASNGIIHVVDSVLLPNLFLDVTGIAQKNYDLTTLVGLLVDNNLVETLQGDGPFTVFAPTNAAFEEISDVLPTLTNDQVVDVLTYHVLAANVESGDLEASQTVEMLNEQNIDITVEGGVVTIEDASGGFAEVTIADQVGSNGVVHIIDAVLIPDFDGGNGGGDQAVTLPVTFEDDNVDYALTDFGGNISEIVADPTDGTNTVAQSTKGAGSEVWAGTTIGGNDGFENPIPFTETETTMSVRVWSPTAGTPIRLKVEDATDGGISVETEANTTVAQEWETLVFDFSNEVEGNPLNLSNFYDKASIFFNFGTSGSDETYYWDDVEFGGEANGGGDPIGDDIIINGDFADGFNSWTPFAADFAGASADFNADDGEAAITNISVDGSTVWHIQLNQILTPDQISALQVGSNYKVEFDARGGVDGRQLKLYFGEDGGGFAALHEANFNLTTTTATYEAIFEVGQTFGDMKLGFEMGLSTEDVFIDNVSMTVTTEDPTGGGNGGGGGDVAEPTSAAPTPPTRDAADVISVYSDAYTDIGVTTYATTWSEGSEVGDVEIANGDFIKLYDIGNFIGIELENYIDLTDFTHMHFDFWVADESVDAGAVFNPKLSNHANQDGETSAIGSVNEVTETGQWISFDVALNDFTDEFGNGVLDRESIFQIVMTTSGTINNVYIDNLYFYKE